MRHKRDEDLQLLARTEGRGARRRGAPLNSNPYVPYNPNKNIFRLDLQWWRWLRSRHCHGCLKESKSGTPLNALLIEKHPWQVPGMKKERKRDVRISTLVVTHVFAPPINIL